MSAGGWKYEGTGHLQLRLMEWLPFHLNHSEWGREKRKKKKKKQSNYDCSSWQRWKESRRGTKGDGALPLHLTEQHELLKINAANFPFIFIAGARPQVMRLLHSHTSVCISSAVHKSQWENISLAARPGPTTRSWSPAQTIFINVCFPVVDWLILQITERILYEMILIQTVPVGTFGFIWHYWSVNVV